MLSNDLIEWGTKVSPFPLQCLRNTCWEEGHRFWVGSHFGPTYSSPGGEARVGLSQAQGPGQLKQWPPLTEWPCLPQFRNGGQWRLHRERDSGWLRAADKQKHIWENCWISDLISNFKWMYAAEISFVNQKISLEKEGILLVECVCMNWLHPEPH